MLSRLQRLFIKGGEDSDFKEVMRGGSLAFIYRMLNMLVSYGLMVFISRKLGDEGIGIYNLCLAILSILIMLSCLGFNTSVVRFVSQYNAEGDFLKIKNLYRSIIGLIIPLSFVIGLILFLGADYLATRIYDDPSLTLPFQILSIILPFGVVTALNVEFIRGLKLVQISEFFRNLGIHVITLAVIIVASFYSLQSHFPLIAYLIGVVFATLITLIFIASYFKKHNSDSPANTLPLDFTLKSHLIISIPMILTSFIQILNGQVDTVMLGLFKSQSTGDVGVFTVALKISVVTNFMIGALKSIAMPKISELFWSNKFDQLKDLIRRSTKFIFLFAAPVSLLLMIFPEFILKLVKPEFVSGSMTLRIFALTQLINATCGLVAIFLNMTGNQVFFTRLVAITTTVNILLNWFLIPIYGMEGAAVATLVATASWNFVGAYFIWKKYKVATFFNLKSLQR